MTQVLSPRSLLYVGLAGAACIIGYGIVKIVPARHITVLPPVETFVTAPSKQAIIAKRLIHRGQVVRAEDLGATAIAGALPAGVLTSATAVIGKVAVTDIAPSQFILSTVISSDPGRAGLAMLVPVGFRAIAFRTNDEVAVGNFIRPGDHVDVELVLPDAVLPGGGTPTNGKGSLSEAHALLQNVTVLSVGATIGSGNDSVVGDAPDRRVDAPVGITMAMTPDQIAQFVLGRSIGTIFLSLRNPTDPQSIKIDTSILKDIRGNTPPPATTTVQDHRPIELITGGQARTIYSVSPTAQR
jgi:pilus assembly protein CpaB